MSARRGWLRLKALQAADLVSAHNTLTQVLKNRNVQVTARVAISAMQDGQRAGLAMLQVQPNWIGVVQSQGQRHLTFATAEVEAAGSLLASKWLQLRMSIADEQVQYAYGMDDGKTFHEFGTPAKLRFS